VTPSDRVATAGSCFAQHIARHLRAAGFNYFISEPANSVICEPAAIEYNYGVFSSRYGNLYTSRQLIQLLQRAYGLFRPSEDVWVRADGRLIDPFRPQIQPAGFASMAEYDADRRQHLASVRYMIENMNVFVFTLGLTESWRSKVDGATYPLCPGVAGGDFSSEKYEFVNLTVSDVLEDMNSAIKFIGERNSSVRIILTVSPVPLIATYEDRSALVSTIYSKSVLRVVCEELSKTWRHVAYFPSYEIITGNHAGGGYFASDLRTVTESGVRHVMNLFMKHYAARYPDADEVLSRPESGASRGSASPTTSMDSVVGVICDEVALVRQQ
jgi:hypothetical protein